jgi:hypothetical protein
VTAVAHPDGAQLVGIKECDDGRPEIQDLRGEEYYRHEHLKSLPAVLKSLLTGEHGPLASCGTEAVPRRDDAKQDLVEGVPLACELMFKPETTAAEAMIANMAAASHQLATRAAANANLAGRALEARLSGDTTDPRLRSRGPAEDALLASTARAATSTYTTLVASVHQSLDALGRLRATSRRWDHELELRIDEDATSGGRRMNRRHRGRSRTRP